MANSRRSTQPPTATPPSSAPPAPSDNADRADSADSAPPDPALVVSTAATSNADALRVVRTIARELVQLLDELPSYAGVNAQGMIRRCRDKAASLDEWLRAGEAAP